MNTLTLKEVEDQVFLLSERGQYQEAFDLVGRAETVFAVQNLRSTFYNWRMCLAAKSGKPDTAIQILREAVEAGYWYSEYALRQDSDLSTLQGLPSFEELVTISLKRASTADAQANPLLKVLEPENHPTPYPVLIALHGAGENAELAAPHWEAARQAGWLVAVVQSSQVARANGFSWDNRPLAIQEIQDHYHSLRADYPIDPQRIIIAGFSMGGGLAAFIALGGHLPVRGFISVAPFVERISELTAAVDQHQPTALCAYLIAGEQDTYCLHVAMEISTLLKSHQIPQQMEVYPGQKHHFPPEFPQKLPTILEFVLGA